MALGLDTIVMAAANVGAVGYMAWKISTKVDLHSETIPVIVKTLETISASSAQMLESQKELFDSRNEHSERLKTIETIHHINGCNEPLNRRSSDRASGGGH